MVVVRTGVENHAHGLLLGALLLVVFRAVGLLSSLLVSPIDEHPSHEGIRLPMPFAKLHLNELGLHHGTDSIDEIFILLIPISSKVN